MLNTVAGFGYHLLCCRQPSYTVCAVCLCTTQNETIIRTDPRHSRITSVRPLGLAPCTSLSLFLVTTTINPSNQFPVASVTRLLY